VRSSEDLFYEGTQIGVERCVARMKTSLVDEALAQTICIAKHEHALPASSLTGRGGYEQKYGYISFGGRVTNVSSDTIVTAFTMNVSPKGSAARARKDFPRLALKPNSSQSFDLSSDDLKAAPPTSADVEFYWDVTNVRGIRIVER
jgi:hypothetical protein